MRRFDLIKPNTIGLRKMPPREGAQMPIPRPRCSKGRQLKVQVTVAAPAIPCPCSEIQMRRQPVVVCQANAYERNATAKSDADQNGLQHVSERSSTQRRAGLAMA